MNKMSKRKRYLSFLLILSFTTTIFSQTLVGTIKQITPTTIYVTRTGTTLLDKGQILTVKRSGQIVGQLEVLFLSTKSIASKLQGLSNSIKVGDSVFAEQVQEKEQDVPEIKPSEVSMPLPVSSVKSQPKSTSRAERPSSIRGRIAAQWYQFIDNSDLNAGFIQPALRFRLYGDRLLDGSYEFDIKSRSRYTDRDRPFTSDLNQDKWQNRIYQASFGRKDRERAFGFQVGRVFNDQLPNVGPVDGAVFNWNPNSKNQIGAYYGFKPEWQYQSLQSDFKKYGVYYNREAGDHSKLYWTGSVALNSEYNGSQVNRDYVYISNQVQWNQTFNFFQSAEVDIMRDWRKDVSNSSYEVSNFFTYLNYTFGPRITAGFSYDNRKDVPTSEYLTSEEQYFDNLYRQGLRLNVYLKLFSNSRLNLNYGKRSQDQGSDTTSYMVNFYQPRLFKFFSLSMRYNGYKTAYTDGNNPSVSLSWNMKSGHSLQVGYHQSDYTLLSTQDQISYSWYDFQAYFYLTKSFYTSFQYEYKNQTGQPGQYLFFELGYRFK